MRNRYQLQFSFDDAGVANHLLTLQSSFSTEEALADALVKDFPLAWERMGDVIVLFPFHKETKSTNSIISGRIMELGSNEALPYTHLSVNGHNTTTDINGHFVYKTNSDAFVHLKASHLGCFILDTLLAPSKDHIIHLRPKSLALPELIVSNNRIHNTIQMGSEPGTILLNSHIAKYMPGNGDNSIFNLLRLQPGILAAGEQPNDLIIWGSNEGTSRVKLDGFTIWGLRNFNDNISVINPFITKNIEVLKGGYDASNTDVTGGIVDITAKTGNNSKVGADLFLNNHTINSMFQIPLSHKSTFILAYRQTFYELFEPDDLLRRSADSYEYKIHVEPKYDFRDFNAKYTLTGNNGDLFFISLLAGGDQFSYNAKQERPYNTIHQNVVEKNRQGGGTAHYGKLWKDGQRTDFKLSYSMLKSDFKEKRSLQNNRFNRLFSRVDDQYINHVNELSFELSNRVSFHPNHRLEFGVEAMRNEVFLYRDSFDVVLSRQNLQHFIVTGFIQDEISIGQKFTMKPGIRINRHMPNKAFYYSPRLSLGIDVSHLLKFNLAGGLYRQFLVKSSVMDENGNYRYWWTISDSKYIPALKSEHLTTGLILDNNAFSASIEGYYKSTAGLTRFIVYRLNQEKIFVGQSRSYGVNFFAKKNFSRHSVWASYSLSLTEELFPYFPEQTYRRSPHDQRHEIKSTGMFDFDPFNFSYSIVHGSGFPLYQSYLRDNYIEKDYNRIDVSLVYKKQLGMFNSETGISVVNLFNSENIKYSSFERIPLAQQNTAYIDAESVPFTVYLFLKLGF
ncbi:TonB-dependent receptor [Geofilum rubicundum]|uniref:TonB-dependent receptor n=1 Tax=Geofilum rubicundum TaxID=472113 RepID=UPI00138DEFDF|nr:TonB-dependent receptor plug domain-containing protein [Geofilum rubicundum]